MIRVTSYNPHIKIGHFVTYSIAVHLKEGQEKPHKDLERK